MHVNYGVISGKINDRTLADIITDAVAAVNACYLPQHRQTSVNRHRSDIREQHRIALIDVCPPKLSLYCVDLLTDFAVSQVHLEHVDDTDGTGVVLHCRVMTAQSLSELQKMIDSGRLSRLFSDMLTNMTDTGGLMSRIFCGIFRWFTGTAITATVSLSTREYSTASAALTGKFHIIIIVTLSNCYCVFTCLPSGLECCQL